MDWSPIFLTFKLAGLTTLLLFVVGLPLAYWLAYSRIRGKAVVETLVSLPLVLPPTVLGFYLLILFSPNKGLGKWLLDTFDIQLVFSFPGIVLASMIYSLPFMVQPIQAGFSNLPAQLKEASYVLGKSRLFTLRKVLLPNMRPALLTAVVLTFAHTIGEFGIVLMIGGNIPGQTKVASIAIYDEVEKLNYEGAHLYAALLLGITFVILLAVYTFNRKGLKSWYT